MCVSVCVSKLHVLGPFGWKEQFARYRFRPGQLQLGSTFYNSIIEIQSKTQSPTSLVLIYSSCSHSIIASLEKALCYVGTNAGSRLCTVIEEVATLFVDPGC